MIKHFDLNLLYKVEGRDSFEWSELFSFVNFTRQINFLSTTYCHRTSENRPTVLGKGVAGSEFAFRDGAGDRDC